VARYAEFEDLETYVGDRVALPIQPEAERMLDRATDLIAAKTGQWAEFYWLDPAPDPLPSTMTALTRAACQQVEFWLEVGEEHDIVGMTGSFEEVLGRHQTSRLPPRLGPRARDTLVDAGILSSAVSII